MQVSGLWPFATFRENACQCCGELANRPLLRLNDRHRDVVKTTIAIEFPTPEAALEWWDVQADAGLMPDDTEPYEADGLDMGSRARPGEFVIRDISERDEQRSLRRLVAAREEAAVTGGEKARAKVRRVRSVD